MSEHESQERLLSAAKTLMLTHGYAATTVDAICEKAGLTKGSFYHFYKSKEELGLAVLRWSLRQSESLLSVGPYVELTDPVARALGYLEHVEKCSGQLWSGGCILATFTLELAETNDRMQRAVSSTLQGIADQIATILEPLVESMESPAPSARDLADQFLGTLEGAIILGKAHRDWTRIPRALRSFRLSLAASLPQPA